MEQRHNKPAPEGEHFAALLALAKRTIEYQTRGQTGAADATVRTAKIMAASLLSSPQDREKLGIQYQELSQTDKSMAHLVYRFLQNSKAVTTQELRRELGLSQGKGKLPNPKPRIR